MCLFIPDRTPATGQRNDLWNLAWWQWAIWVIYRNMGYLQRHGWLRDSCIIVEPTPAWAKTSRSSISSVPGSLQPAPPKDSLLSQLWFIACMTSGRSLVDLLPFWVLTSLASLVHFHSWVWWASFSPRGEQQHSTPSPGAYILPLPSLKMFPKPWKGCYKCSSVFSHLQLSSGPLYFSNRHLFSVIKSHGYSYHPLKERSLFLWE